MQPTLEEVQQMLNQAVQLIIRVSQRVARWNQGKKTSNEQIHESKSDLEAVETQIETGSVDNEERGGDTETHTKNYYKAVRENKDIAKIASILSTSISSNKRVRFLR